jgi:hypothetical protein
LRLTTRCRKKCMLKCPRNDSENATRMLENVPLKTRSNASETVCKNATNSTHEKVSKNAQIHYRIRAKCQQNASKMPAKCP